jgi:Ribosomal protein L23
MKNYKSKNKKAMSIDLNKSYKIITKPLVTEKATKLSEFNKIVFSVPLEANKFEIKYAIEKIFSVKVNAINTIITKGKTKRFKGILGKRNNFKKAIVTLQKGNSIDLAAGV